MFDYFLIILSLFSHYFLIICALDIIIFIILLPKKARALDLTDWTRIVQAKYPGRKIGSYSDGLGLEARGIGATVPAVTSQAHMRAHPP